MPMNAEFMPSSASRAVAAWIGVNRRVPRAGRR
jgi:hypothetical protein